MRRTAYKPSQGPDMLFDSFAAKYQGPNFQ